LCVELIRIMFSINRKCFPIYSIYRLVFLKQGVFNLPCAMDPFEGLVKPTEPFTEKNTSIHKIKYMNIEYRIYMYYNPYLINCNA